MNIVDALRWCQAHHAVIWFERGYVRVEARHAASGVMVSRVSETFIDAVMRLAVMLETTP